MISTGTHWGPSDPNVGINLSRRWTPTPEVNINTTIAKVPRTTRHNIITLGGVLTPWTAAT